MVRWGDYDTGGNIFPGDENIAKAIRADVRTVKRLRKSLTAKGYLILVKSRRGNSRLASVYQLSAPTRQGDTDVTLDGAKVTNEAGQGDISRSQGDTRAPTPTQGTTQSSNPSSEPGSARDDGWRGGPSADSQNQRQNPGTASPVSGSLVPVSDSDVIDGVVVPSPDGIDWDDLLARSPGRRSRDGPGPDLG